jgi:hypothetical protein
LDQARRAENKLGLAEHLADASARLGVSTFALALLLAGAEPEELATAVTAALRGVPSIAYGDVIGTNVAMCTSRSAWAPCSPRCRSVAGCAATPCSAYCAAGRTETSP